MRLLTTGWLLLLACGLLVPALSAQAQGDFAPRNSLVYARVGDLSDALKRVGGENWVQQAQDLLRMVPEDMEEQQVAIDEVKSFVNHLGETELVIADIMVREPNVQMILIVRLKPGAPTEFSEAFRTLMKDEGGRDTKVAATEISVEHVTLRIRNNALIMTVGGAADIHVKDVLDGVTDNSLSQVERFKKWNKTASGDVVAWADMAAWRTSVDRLGEDFDSEVKQMLDFVEWQKWDAMSASLTLPGASSGAQLRATLTMTEPLKRAAAFLRPANASKLAATLPEETIGFASLQLGVNHDQTLQEILAVLHDYANESEPARIKQRMTWCEESIENTKTWIEETKSSEDLSEEEKKERIAQYEEQIKNQQEQLSAYREQLAGFKARPFQPDKGARGTRGTEPERFLDELDEFLKTLGVTRREAGDALGSELVLGALDLPDPEGDDDLDFVEHAWFVAVETQGNFDEIKQRVLDRLLARKLPDDMTEEDREDMQRRATSLIRYDVPGGEILSDRGVRSDIVFFAGSGIVGAAASDFVARRVLEAASGRGRLDTRKLGGGTSGSKLGWADLKALFARMVRHEHTRGRRQLRFPVPVFDLDLGLPAGASLALNTDESQMAISLRATLTGERGFGALFPMFRNELITERQWRHDNDDLGELSSGIQRWRIQNEDALAELSGDEYRTLVASVTPEMLVEKAFYQPTDGLRSAFDPAMRERFEAAQNGRDTRFGAADKAADLGESGYQWYGLCPHKWPERELEEEEKRIDYYYDTLGPIEGWLVMAHKAPWARDGRVALLEYYGYWSTVWLTEADFQALLKANAMGKMELPAADRPRAELPEWKARVELGRHIWELSNMQQVLQQRRNEARAEGRDYSPKFDGGTYEELVKLLDDENDNYEYMSPRVKRIKIWTTDDGVFVRESEGALWVEVGPKGQKASWQPE
ncbi:MAG: hypothetical protein IPK87_09475 [Planctomycetes bacterium]|nr:hypothetical protein [Planctomycetota bacterium]